MKRLVFAVAALSVALASVPRLASAAAPEPVASASPGVSASPTATAAATAAARTSSAVRTTLANGMHVIVLPDPLAPVALTVMTYGVGSQDDTIPGIAHAAEHMMFRGTAALSGPQLAATAVRMGATYNAFTTEQATLYYYKIPSAYVPLAVRIEADRMQNAAVTAEAWSTERGAIEQEVRAHESSPVAPVVQRLRDAFYGSSPIAHAPVGTIAGFDKMTPDDIRAFYHRYYTPANATLTIAGDVDPNLVMTDVHRAFDGIAMGAIAEHPSVPTPPLTTAVVRADVDFPFAVAAAIYRLPGSTSPDHAAAKVLAGALGAQRGELADLTTTGKTLGVVTLPSAIREEGSMFLVAIPAQGDTADHAMSLVDGVLDDYRVHGVPSDLIAAAKERLLAGDATANSSISGLGLAWAANIADGAAPPADEMAEVAAVTDDDVNRLMRADIVSDHRVSMMLAPKASASAAHVTPSSAGEHVGVTASGDEPLPAWVKSAFAAPLKAPSDARARTLVGHLPNGLRYTIRRETQAPAVIVYGVVRTSPLLYAPRGKDGVDEMTAGMLNYGTTTQTREQYERAFDGIAATHSLGSTFALGVRSEDFERGLNLLADGMLHPAFAPESFAVVKGQYVQSVTGMNQLPATRAQIARASALYVKGDPRLRRMTAATAAAVTLDDVRKYYRFAYRPDVSAIAIVGDVEPKAALAALTTAFGGWHASGAPPSFAFPNVAQKRGGTAVVVHSKSATQSEVTLQQTFTMHRGDPDYVPLQLANTIMSGEETGSLLFRELRTRRGYVYNVESDFTVDQTGANFSVSYASDPKNAERAAAAVRQVLAQLRDHPLPLDELQRAKALLLARRILPLDSYAGIAQELMAGVSTGYTGDDAWYWTALAATTPAQLQHAMRRIDPSRFVRVTVAPGE